MLATEVELRRRVFTGGVRLGKTIRDEAWLGYRQERLVGAGLSF
jgi:hypothetical protein